MAVQDYFGLEEHLSDNSSLTTRSGEEYRTARKLPHLTRPALPEARAPMNGPRTASYAPVGHLSGLRGRLFSGGIILILALLAAPVLSYGQQPGKVYRIGYLGAGTAPTEQTAHHCPSQPDPYWQALVEGLREHGYMPGQNLLIECRYTEGREERAPALAAELVSLKPDLIVVDSTVQVRAAKQATTEIPIVMVGVIDPVRRGLVASLAHPGGNVTGLTDTLMAMEGKRLEFLKEAVPTLSRVAVLYHVKSGPPEPTNFFFSLLRVRSCA